MIYLAGCRSRVVVHAQEITAAMLVLAAAIVGPTDGVVPAISAVTLYRLNNRVIDDGAFIALSNGTDDGGGDRLA